MSLHLTTKKNGLVAVYMSLLASKILYNYFLGIVSNEALVASQILLLLGIFRLLSYDSFPFADLPLTQVAWHTLFESLYLFVPLQFKLNPLPESQILILLLFTGSICLQSRLLYSMGFLDDPSLANQLGVTSFVLSVRNVHLLAYGAPWLGYNTSVVYFLWNLASWSHSLTSCSVLVLFFGTVLFLLWYRFYRDYEDHLDLHSWPEPEVYLDLFLMGGLCFFMVLNWIVNGLAYSNVPFTVFLHLVSCFFSWELLHYTQTSCLDLEDSESENSDEEDSSSDDGETSSDGEEDSTTEDFSSHDEEEEDPFVTQELIELRLKFQEALLRYLAYKYKSSPNEDARCQMCAICLEPLALSGSNVKVPACAHVFHPDCLTPWALKHDSCPSCRGPLFQ